MKWKKERPVMFQCEDCKLIWILQLESTEDIGRNQSYKCPYCNKGDIKYIWAFKS